MARATAMLFFLCLILVGIEVACVTTTSTTTTTNTTFTGQVFCDNRCSIYFNGDKVYSQTINFPHVVSNFSFNASSSNGKRTFAIEMRDNSEVISTGGFSTIAVSALLPTSVDYYTCIGDGAVRFYIENDECPSQEIVLSGADFNCQTGITGADIGDCFNQTQIEDDFYLNGTTPVISNGKTELFDADCIANVGTNGCLQSLVWNGSDLGWIETGFDDSGWTPASEYSAYELIEANGAERLTYNASYCNKQTGDNTYYCFYNESEWKGSSVMWTDDAWADNLVYCRYEYEFTGCDSSGIEDEDEDENGNDLASRRKMPPLFYAYTIIISFVFNKLY